MKFGLKEHVKFQTALAAALAADANGLTIDRQGYEGPVTFLAQVGVSGDTLSGSLYLLLEVEESDDDSTWTDVADADLEATVSGANTGTFAKIDDPAEDAALYQGRYIGSKRYVRVVTNIVGTHTNGMPTSVVAALEQARHLPVTQGT